MSETWRDVFAPDPGACPAIVLDCGAHHTRAGYGGSASPRLDLPTLVGYPRHRGVAMAAGMRELEVGESAVAKRGMLTTRAPIAQGRVVDWDALEGFWRALLYSQLQATPERHAFLTTTPVDAPGAERERVLELLMETFHVRALYLGPSPVLSLFAYGKTTGVVVDSGADRTMAVPVFEGYALGRQVTQSPVAGGVLTRHLGARLAAAGYSFGTAVEQAALERAKARVGVVRRWDAAETPTATDARDDPDPDAVFTLPDGQSLPLHPHRHATTEVLFNFGLLNGQAWAEAGPAAPESGLGSESRLTAPDARPAGVYDPPYKVRIELGEWFTPSFPKGISWLPFAAIHRCDLAMQAALYANVVLAGNTLNFPGTRARLQDELVQLYREKHASEAVLPIHVWDMPWRGYSAWLGASVISQMSLFPQLAITRQEYEENGPRVVHYKG